jgi:large subunit ribosomal protein L31
MILIDTLLQSIIKTRIKRVTSMKKDIHPEYTVKATIDCACGEKYEVGSTNPETKIELCAKCHPFYTGKQKIIDTARRVEKFQKRAELQTDDKTGKKAKAEKRHAQKVAKREEQEKAES